MPNITSIGAGMYTSLAYIDLPCVEGAAADATEVGKGDTAAEWIAYFEATGTPWTVGADAKAFGRIREFPNLGVPANVVNVPQYGQPVSSQITGQSDAPSMDFTFNYVPEEHKFIAEMRESGETFLFRVRLSNAKQAVDVDGVNLPLLDDGALREFSDFYFFGSVASFEVVPNLTDSNQLNATLTIDGGMSGPHSYDAAGANYE
jgi:hypothetical protein